MASPQVGNGHMKIPHTIAEALMKVNLTSCQQRVFWAILRKTWGWHKQKDVISVSQLCKMTGMKHQNVSRTLKELQLMKMITRTPLGTRQKVAIGIQKDYEKWRLSPGRDTVDSTKLASTRISVQDPDSTKLASNRMPLSGGQTGKLASNGIHVRIQPDARLASNWMHTKDQNTNKRKCPNSVEFRLSQILLDLILERRNGFKKPNLEKWADHIGRMIRFDKRCPEEIEAVIRWSQKDDFWRNNILSAEKLRKQFDH